MRFRIPDENPESFPFSQFGWRRIKLLGFLLCHCSTIRHPYPDLTKLERGSRRCRCTGILQLQNWQASHWISALYPAGCASLSALRPASIRRFDDCWNRCHCHLSAGPHIKWTTCSQIIPETKYTFVQARRQTSAQHLSVHFTECNKPVIELVNIRDKSHYRSLLKIHGTVRQKLKGKLHVVWQTDRTLRFLRQSRICTDCPVPQYTSSKTRV